MPAKLLWTPSNVEQTQMRRFQLHIAAKYSVALGEELLPLPRVFRADDRAADYSADRKSVV